ncbi:MAG TPA: 3-hydroxyacyl-CoA dehydrogenase/enoyl-CoA hydratase family protein [Candidatus Marinimicrobia bacterium]|nr:3-hydroxyacyl-CoA dehydrogenase/enoyl-CoA hydratase family protein [Candidatus Neomarinimicrobiota bacterium]
MEKIKKVAVLGSGIMGAQIAAHFANTGIPSVMLDLTKEMAQKGLDTCVITKPSPFYNPKKASMIQVGDYESGLELLRDVDWLIEVVAERLDIKHSVFKKVQPFLKDSCIISSNTSGLQLSDLMEAIEPRFKKRTLITHFFNPPRYLKLLELIYQDDIDLRALKTIEHYGENILGKGIVHAKDTPNFIANRIGVYGMLKTVDVAMKLELSVTDVDKLTGPLIGHPKSATYRTADLVGLDTLLHVANNTYKKCPADEERELFKSVPIVEKLVEMGNLGQKSKAGFYKKLGRDILGINPKTMEYVSSKPTEYDSVRAAKSRGTLERKIKVLAWADDRAGIFTWETLSSTLLYAANRIPEIADDIISIDNGMKWGFGWEMGPFEVWDAIELEKSVNRLKKEGKKIPAWIETMLKYGYKRFYQRIDQVMHYYDVASGKMQPIKTPDNVLRIADLKAAKPSIRRNWSADIIDMGDGVLGVEFHSALQPLLNPIDGTIIDALYDVIDEVQKRSAKGVLIGHDGVHFSAGANLAQIKMLCDDKRWADLEKVSKYMQDMTQALRYAPFPVVAAPFGFTLGGAYELAGAVDRIVAHAETYCGLVEAGVGLLPGAGGNLRLLTRWYDKLAPLRPGPLPPVQKTFETIGFAKVSTSAAEAIALGYFSKNDIIVVNRDHQLYTAKQTVIQMAEKYQPPKMRDDLILPGHDGYLAMESAINGFLAAGTISNHDALIGKKIAYVLTGGERAGLFTPVDEQYLLDIEREAFVELAQTELTQARIAHMLKTGKPLRN